MCIILAMINIAANVKTIKAEHGTSTTVPIISPNRPAKSEIITEVNIKGLNRRTKTSAIIMGKESIDINNITPTRRIVNTMHNATITVMVVEINVTGSPETWAKSLSKAQATICLNFHAKKTIRSKVKIENAQISPVLIVKIFPNKKVLSSGTYPGVINTNITPIAIPIAHITAMAESSRILCFFDNQSTPKEDPTANTDAMATGLIPK